MCGHLIWHLVCYEHAVMRIKNYYLTSQRIQSFRILKKYLLGMFCIHYVEDIKSGFYLTSKRAPIDGVGGLIRSSQMTLRTLYSHQAGSKILLILRKTSSYIFRSCMGSFQVPLRIVLNRLLQRRHSHMTRCMPSS